jgi:hypothetical protein
LGFAVLAECRGQNGLARGSGRGASQFEVVNQANSESFMAFWLPVGLGEPIATLEHLKVVSVKQNLKSETQQ